MNEDNKYTEEELKRMEEFFIKIIKESKFVYIPYMPLIVIPHEKES